MRPHSSTDRRSLHFGLMNTFYAMCGSMDLPSVTTHTQLPASVKRAGRRLTPLHPTAASGQVAEATWAAMASLVAHLLVCIGSTVPARGVIDCETGHQTLR
jgi:hypothetical protein